MVRPVIEGVGSVGSTRVMLEEASDCALSFILPLEGWSGEKKTDIAQNFMKRAIDAYLDRVRSRPIGENGLVTKDEYVASEWRNLIIQAGRTRLKV